MPSQPQQSDATIRTTWRDFFVEDIWPCLVGAAIALFILGIGHVIMTLQERWQAADPPPVKFEDKPRSDGPAGSKTLDRGPDHPPRLVAPDGPMIPR